MEIDFTSSVSQAYQKLFEKMLDDERRKNDGLELSIEKTSQIRGRISLLKELLALPRVRDIELQQIRSFETGE